MFYSLFLNLLVFKNLGSTWEITWSGSVAFCVKQSSIPPSIEAVIIKAVEEASSLENPSATNL